MNLIKILFLTNIEILIQKKRGPLQETRNPRVTNIKNNNQEDTTQRRRTEPQTRRLPFPLGSFVSFFFQLPSLQGPGQRRNSVSLPSLFPFFLAWNHHDHPDPSHLFFATKKTTDHASIFFSPLQEKKEAHLHCSLPLIFTIFPWLGTLEGGAPSAHPRNPY